MGPVLRRRAWAAAGLAACLLLAAAWLVWTGRGAGRSGAFDGEALPVYARVPAFTLVERSGRRVRRDDLRGAVWVADFIYTDCQDTCPLLSRQFQKLQAALADAPDFRLVSISVDPAHDTPDVLRRYAARYAAGDRWLFLTGNRHAIACLIQTGFKLPTAEGASLDCGGHVLGLGPPAAWAHGGRRDVLHTSRVVLVDREARIRGYYAGEDPAALAALSTDARRVLAER